MPGVNPATGRPTFDLTVLDDRLVVYRRESSAPIPPALLTSPGFFSITRTADELSIVCAERDAPPHMVDGRRWRGLKVEGPLPFDMVGVIAELSRVVAAAGVSLLAVATHDTDYLLVDDRDLIRTVRALRENGHRVADHPALAGS